MARTTLRHGAAALLLMCLAGAAAAQYVWTDERGVRQYSDRPPPADVPASRIIKGPGMAAKPEPAAPAAGSAAASAAAPAPGKPAPTLAERNADFNKRRAEQGEKDKKAAEDALVKADRKEGCQRAREYSGALASGERLTRTDASGERNYLTEAQRDKEMAEVRKVLADCQ